MPIIVGHDVATYLSNCWIILHYFNAGIYTQKKVRYEWWSAVKINLSTQKIAQTYAADQVFVQKLTQVSRAT